MLKDVLVTLGSEPMHTLPHLGAPSAHRLVPTPTPRLGEGSQAPRLARQEPPQLSDIPHSTADTSHTARDTQYFPSVVGSDLSDKSCLGVMVICTAFIREAGQLCKHLAMAFLTPWDNEQRGRQPSGDVTVPHRTDKLPEDAGEGPYEPGEQGAAKLSSMPPDVCFQASLVQPCLR